MSSYVRELDSVAALCRSEGQLGHAVVQGLDLRKLGVDWDEVECEGAIFLGCGFPDGVEIADLLAKGAMVFPGFSDLPFDPYRPRLYSRAELMEGWTPLVDQSVDKKIYDYFVGAGKDRPSVIDALAQRLHDIFGKHRSRSRPVNGKVTLWPSQERFFRQDPGSWELRRGSRWFRETSRTLVPRVTPVRSITNLIWSLAVWARVSGLMRSRVRSPRGSSARSENKPPSLKSSRSSIIFLAGWNRNLAVRMINHRFPLN